MSVYVLISTICLKDVLLRLILDPMASLFILIQLTICIFIFYNLEDGEFCHFPLDQNHMKAFLRVTPK